MDDEEVSSRAEEYEQQAKKDLKKKDSESATRNLMMAEKLWKSMGLPERAAEMWGDFKHYSRSAEIWKKMGSNERAAEMEAKKELEQGEVLEGQSKDIITRNASLFLAIASFSISLFFLGQNTLTGFAVYGAPMEYSVWFGSFLLVISLIFFFIYLRGKRKRGKSKKKISRR